MNEKTYKASFVKALGGLALTLGEAVQEARFLAYFEIFKNYDPESVLTAIDQAGLTCKFFPKPAELIELITGGKGGGQDPTVAWREVIDALERYGTYRDVEFKDGAIAAAIEGLGGWAALGGLTYEEMGYQKIPAQFARLYAEAVRVGAHLKPGVVAGRDSIANNSNGYQVEARPVEARTLKQIAESVRARAEEAKKSPAALPAPPISAEEQAAALGIVKKFTERQLLQNPIPGSALKQQAEDLAEKEHLRRRHNSERAEAWQ